MPTLDWTGKQDAIKIAKRIPYRLLEYDSELSCGDGDNLIVQGDNLDALNSLLPFYRGRVKCVYIDPPYNTGSAFEHYDDNLEHATWLSMMYPRLELLREFLSDDGAIFISIDDNEQAHLKLICDEIFGANNFVAQLVWEKKKKGAFLSKTVTNVKEYILVYCKVMNSFGGLIGEINRSPETYPCINAINRRERRIIPYGIESKYKQKNFFQPAGTRISDTTMDIVYLTDLVIENGVVVKDFEVEGNWRYSQELMTQYALNKELYITRDLYLRRIIDTPRIKMLKDLLLRVGSDGNSESVFTYDENLNHGGWGTNEDANEELHKIFGKQYVFEFSKPSRLIAKLIQSITDKNSIVLDAFAGSGTTAHAVIDLNTADGGNRKFILIEAKDYCRTITAERVKRVGGSFRFYSLGATLFDDKGSINPNMTFQDRTAYIWSKSTKTPYTLNDTDSPLIGIHDGTAYYVFNEVLTAELLKTLPPYDGAKIIFATACRISAEILESLGITFQQIPTEIR